LSSHTVNEPRAFSAALYCGQFVVWYRLRGVVVFIPPVSHGLSGWAEPFVQQSLLAVIFLDVIVVAPQNNNLNLMNNLLTGLKSGR
jgi:hypothetical protein